VVADAVMTFILRNTFTDGVMKNGNSDVWTELAAENEVKAEAIEEQERWEDKEKVPISPFSSAAAAAAALDHCDEWQSHWSSKESAPPAMAIQWTMEEIENEIRDEGVEKQPAQPTPATLSRPQPPHHSPPPPPATLTPLPCSAVTSEFYRERQPGFVSSNSRPVAMQQPLHVHQHWSSNSANLESKIPLEHQPPLASLTSRQQQELPLNMSLCAQRTWDMQPTLKRVHSIASNCIRVAWTIDQRKLFRKDQAVTSPRFEIWEGGTFILILRSSPHKVKGGFHGSRGVGRVELKFCGGIEFAGKVHYRVAAGKKKELPFQSLDHDFITRPHSILQQEWNFLSVVNKGSLLVHLEARMETKPA